MAERPRYPWVIRAIVGEEGWVVQAIAWVVVIAGYSAGGALTAHNIVAFGAFALVAVGFVVWGTHAINKAQREASS